MSWKNAKYDKLFGRNGTEGMLDVILACTLIFLLISCLIRLGESEAQERVLPAVKLSKSAKKIAGTTSVKKNTITLKSKGDSAPDIFLDNNVVSLQELKNFLQVSQGITHIALRRDNNISCMWEDKIIMLCREYGITRVGIVIKTENHRP
ncbi:MAG TPA: biopolymer transporter ExbD [Victivallales bacterium]|nr:biopolymer transporter ExbD [Victivallales bacterium]